MMEINVDLLQQCINVLIKKSASLARSDNLPARDRSTSGEAIKNKIISKLAEELHKSIIRKYKKGKIHLSFIDII